MKKRIVSIILVLVMAFGISSSCFAWTGQDSFNYSGPCIAWVREFGTNMSPLTPFEALSGYVAEIDYIDYYTAAVIGACKEDYTLFNQVKNYVLAGTLGYAAQALSKSLGFAVGSIPEAAILAVAALSWSYVQALDNANFQATFKSMSKTDYMKITYMMSYSSPGTGSIVRSYSKWSSLVMKGDVDRKGSWHLETYSVLWKAE